MAQAYFDRSGLRPQIRSVLQPAGDFLDHLVAFGEAEFDMVFIDANKSKYREYYDKVIGSGLLRVGGILVADNVLFKVRSRAAQSGAAWMSTLHLERVFRQRKHRLTDASFIRVEWPCSMTTRTRRPRCRSSCGGAEHTHSTRRSDWPKRCTTLTST